MTLTVEEAKAQALAKIGAGRVDLVYVDYDDRLTDEQIAAFVRTSEWPESFLNWYDEARQTGARHWLRENLDSEVREALEADAGSASDEVDEALMAADRSDPYTDLLRQSGKRLWRYRIGDGDPWDLDPDSWAWDDRRKDREAKRLAGLLGVNEDTWLPQMVELVENATGGGTLWVVWYGDVVDLVNVAVADRTTTTGMPERTITWPEGSYVVVLDRYNGSGHDVKVTDPLAAEWHPDRLVLDSEDFGCSWDSVCGLVYSAYETACRVSPGLPAGEG